MTTTMTASEALEIVAKDETKVARPRIKPFGVVGRTDFTPLYLGLVKNYNDKEIVATCTFANDRLYLYGTSIDIEFLLPSVGWEILNKSDLLQGKE